MRLKKKQKSRIGTFQHFNDHLSPFINNNNSRYNASSENLTSMQRSGEIGECRLSAKGRDGDAPRPSQPGEAEWEEWVGAW